jgi:hypothetical protein
MLTQIISWSSVVLLILWGLYTLRVIKNEKTHFKYHSKTFPLLHYRLFVPAWWGVTLNNPELPALKFERTDTRYDWYAYFSWKKNPKSQSLEDLAQEWLKSEEIEIDPDRKLTEDFRFGIQENVESFYRIEGTATEKESERIYYDLCLIKDKRYEGYFFAESKSSVLNGLVEGPYFEETLKHIETLD